jgi:hypothetical protein
MVIFIAPCISRIETVKYLLKAFDYVAWTNM